MESLSSFGTLKQSMFVVLELQYIGSVVFSCFLAYRRYQHHDPTLKQDIIILILAEIWTLTGNSAAKRLILANFLSLILHVVILGCIRWQNSQPLVKQPGLVPASAAWTKTLIYQSRTTHIRLFPEKHSFGYDYLLVGIPVGLRSRISGLLTVDCPDSAPSLLSIHSTDYLSRDAKYQTLREKLDLYLKEQDTDPLDYPYAYLVTAPRVLGYSFNPASFWYLYNPQKELRAMIVEVNNTFDERRMYFLKNAEPLESDGKAAFATTWTKDFHVSPFNSRDGSYALMSRNPLAQTSTYQQPLSNTITLLSAGGKPKLVARIFSIAQPIDVSKIPFWDSVQLVIRLGWIGFFTFPRILREAATLFFRKGLSVYYRPEIRNGSIARRSKDTERIIEDFFQRFLEHIVQVANLPVCLEYEAPSGMGKGHSRAFRPRSSMNDVAKPLKVEVLSPAFYSRFVNYVSLRHAFDQECFLAEPENVTISITQPQLFWQLLGTYAQNEAKLSCPKEFESTGRPSQLRWILLGRLRCPPEDPSHSKSTANLGLKEGVIQNKKYSAFDIFIMFNCPDSWRYRRLVIQHFLAQRLFFGFTFTLACLDFAWKIFIVTGGLGYAQQSLRKSSFNLHMWHHPISISWASCLVSALSLNGIHPWAFVKGF